MIHRAGLTLLLGILGVLAAAGPIEAQGERLSFFSLQPCRVVDTRGPIGPTGGPKLDANADRSFPVPGLCSVPNTAQAVAFNVTVVQPTDFGDLRLYPAGSPRPLASTINFAQGRVRANNALIPLGDDGFGNQLTVRVDMPPGSSGQVHLVLDVTGYFAVPTVFVSPSGNDANPGTCGQPLRTIQAAITRGASLGRNVSVMQGTYNETSTITLANGVSLLGGFAPDCSRPESGVAEIVVGQPTAIVASGITTPTTLELLTVEGADNLSPGGSAYGLFALNSSGLVIQRSTIIAGNSGAGTNGSNGTPGANGGGGGSGQPGCEDSGFLCSMCNTPAGGAGGSSPVSRPGGAGGSSGLGSSGGGAGGQGAIGTPGGAGGTGGGGPQFCASADLNGKPGATGAAGAPGANGTSGQSFGSTLSSGYVLASSSDGGGGVLGNGGGGGGGGGGGTSGCDSYGSSGGGGGGGGAAGSPGTRGTGGGGSFAVYLWSSNVTIESSTLQTGAGGHGGNGGSGGGGGTGGSGGPGGPYGGAPEQDDASCGGSGGAGGNGGGGGHGGAGGGGPSVGVVRAGGSSPTLASNTFNLGPAGNGGASAGGNGAPGLRQEIY